MRIFIDYNMMITDEDAKDKQLNWKNSKDILPITSEFNYGIEMQTC